MSDKLLLEQILEKQEKTSEDITDIKIVIARQEESLKHHIRRTDLAEENMALLREEMKPIHAHVNYINGALKFVGLLSLVAGFVASVIKIVQHI